MSEPSSGRAPGSRRQLYPCLLPAAAALSALLLVAGCGAATSSPSASASLPTDTASTTPVATPIPYPTATPDPTAAAILHAYDQAVAAYVTAESIPNPDYPGLIQWYTDPQYTQIYGRIYALQHAGYVARGSITPHPTVTAIHGTTATVYDCGYDTTYFVYKANGATPSPQPFGGTLAPGWDSVTATMVLSQSGLWQLASQEEKDDTSCTPGSP